MIQTTLTKDNYHQRHQYTTIHEVEHHIDHNQEIAIIKIIIITQILEIIEIIKDVGDQTTTITEVPVITKTITVETEVTVTIEIKTITDTTIVDQVQDIQTETIQDNSHHITKIIAIIAIIDKDTTAEIRVGTTNIDNVLIVTTDINQTIITRMTAEINHIKTITDIIIKNDAMMETDITLTIIIIITKTE